MLAGVAQTV